MIEMGSNGWIERRYTLEERKIAMELALKYLEKFDGNLNKAYYQILKLIGATQRISKIVGV